MKRFGFASGFILAFFVAYGVILGAQTMNTSLAAHLTFDQEALTLAEANSYQYSVSVNSLTYVVEVVTCTGSTSPFKCKLTKTNGELLGAVANGSLHTATIKAAVLLSDGTFAESEVSAVCNFRIIGAPARPINLRFESFFFPDQYLNHL